MKQCNVDCMWLSSFDDRLFSCYKQLLKDFNGNRKIADKLNKKLNRQKNNKLFKIHLYLILIFFYLQYNTFIFF